MFSSNGKTTLIFCAEDYALRIQYGTGRVWEYWLNRFNRMKHGRFDNASSRASTRRGAASNVSLPA